MTADRPTVTPLTAEDRRRVAGIQEMVEAARPGDLEALWSAEADFRWLVQKAATTLDAARTDPQIDAQRIDSLDARGEADAQEALIAAVKGQNLWHGRHATSPAGAATALAVLSSLRQSGWTLARAALDKEPK